MLTLKRFFRELTGATSIVKHVSAAEARTQQGLLALGNALRFSRHDRDTLRRTQEYLLCAEVIDLVRPRRIEGLDFIRVGGDHDGGYVMLDDLGVVGAAYSCGVGNEITWDLAMAERGIDVFLYDHTVPRPPTPHPRFRFFRTGLCGHAAVRHCEPLDRLIATNGHGDRRDLVLKMDIEGSEWDVLAATTEKTLARFRQIVVEFHELGASLDPARRSPLVGVLAKLARTHQSVHVHGNCAQLPIWIGDLVLPQLLEVSYVRRDDYAGRFVDRDDSFPTELDQPNLAGWPDIHLGTFGAFNTAAAAPPSAHGIQR